MRHIINSMVRSDSLSPGDSARTQVKNMTEVNKHQCTKPEWLDKVNEATEAHDKPWSHIDLMWKRKTYEKEKPDGGSSPQLSHILNKTWGT